MTEKNKVRKPKSKVNFIFLVAIVCIMSVACSQKAEVADNLNDTTIKVIEEPATIKFPVITEKEETTTAEVDETKPQEPKSSAKGITIAIDAGHQASGNNEQEPIGPGAETSKPKVSSGTTGRFTGVPEYQLTLAVSLKLRDELISRGYDVFMVRESHEVNISNRERASMATEAGADIFVRIHADGSDDTSVNGILTLSPTASNPFIPQLYEASYSLSKNVLEAMVLETGAKNRGVSQVDTMSGINWSTMPVTIVEMGLMSNETEDTLMQTDDYQLKLVRGIANGIDTYYSN
jgi:N-acetylmuramoyl-L-alanine amidase